jgi:phenylacetic acid degradation operon negative regulatory protein
MKEKLSDRIFFIIDQVFSATEIIFSRSSLSRKLSEADMLFENENKFLNRSLQRMRKQNLLKEKDRKGEVLYSLTKEGIKKLTEFRLKNILKAAQEWDGFWRVIIFDIPEEMRLFRNVFRRKMISFNFFPLQKSVFVYPFPCEKEIAVLAKFFNAKGYVQVILAKCLGDKEDEVRRFYGKILK